MPCLSVDLCPICVLLKNKPWNAYLFSVLYLIFSQSPQLCVCPGKPPYRVQKKQVHWRFHFSIPTNSAGWRHVTTNCAYLCVRTSKHAGSGRWQANSEMMVTVVEMMRRLPSESAVAGKPAQWRPCIMHLTVSNKCTVWKQPPSFVPIPVCPEGGLICLYCLQVVK